MARRKSAVVVGAGLGGLLSAAVLCRHGCRVTVVERLSFPGGRFTSFNYLGFEVPTGALHLLPGGRRGQLYTALHALDAAPEVVTPGTGLVIRHNDRRHVLSRWPLRRGNFLRRLSLRDRVAWMRLACALLLPDRLPDISLERYVAGIGASPLLSTVVDKLIRFAHSVSIAEASVVEVARSFAAQRWSKEAIIVGGCKAVVDRLVEKIVACGAALHLEDGAARVEMHPANGFLVSTEGGRSLAADLVVSNAGPQETVRLLGASGPTWLRDKAARLLPAWGATYSIRSRTPLLGHSGIEVPLDASEIAGYVQVTNADPALAAPGWHYLLAYQRLAPDDVPCQVERALAELRALFPSLEPSDIFNISVYRDRWPTALVAQVVGQYGSTRYPVVIEEIPGFFMVGDFSQGYGFGAEIIGGAVRALDFALGGIVFGGGGRRDDSRVLAATPSR